MAQDSMYFEWGMRGKLEEQIKSAAKDGEHLREVIQKLQIDISKLSAEQIQKNFSKNVGEAEKALYRLLTAKENIDKALSRNASMRSDGFLGMDESKILQVSARLDDIINKLMNIGSEAQLSKTAVKDMLSSLSADIALKEAKSSTSAMDKGLDKQVRERAKAQKEAIKEVEDAFKDADKAAAINAKNQERVKDALARIATARANLSAASEKGNQQEIAHAQLLMSLLDRLAGKLNSIKGTFLGEKGALDGILGSGYLGLMRNVSAAIKDIGNVDSNVIQSPVKLIAEQDTSAIRSQIDLIGALHTQIKRLYEELGRAANNSTRLMPTNWQELAGRGLYNSKLPYVEQMEFLKKLRAYDGDMAQQKAVVEENIRKLQSQLDVYREAGINVQGYQNHLNALYETYVKLNALQTTDISAKLGLEHLRGYTGPQSALSDEAWASAKREAEIREVAAQAAEKHRQKLAELTAAFERQAKAEEKERQAQAQATAQKERATQAAHKRAQASAETQRNLNKEAGEVVRLRLEMLKTQAVQLQGLIKNGNGTFDAAQLEQYRNALRDIVREITTLKGVMDNLGSFTGRNGSGLLAFGSGTNYSPLIAHGQQALDASRAVNVLTESERKFMESINSASSALRGHGALLGDLQMMATQYLSLWGVRSFLNNIIETGGLLEQQRLSIGAILGSIDKAEVIFGKIKDLAIKSPFGVVQLDTMSKQLTAYGFEYEELFDWTKRLADISAATGTEVSRLALALGHVRSEGALSGYTLRQFAMANVPLLQNLATNLGITTKEVRERTKKKEIGYDEVKKVLQDLTDEGGMFYNAQEVMSEALNAKYKNLRDAFDIMYGEIAESGVGDLLKGIAEALTAGAKEWHRFGTDILFTAGAFGIVKASIAAYQSGMIALSRQMGVLALNTKSYTATQVQQLAAEGAITRAQLLRAVASGRLSVEQARLAGATLGVSEATLRQAASSGTVTKAMVGNALATSRFTVAQLRLMATLRAQGVMFPVLRVGLMGLASGFRAVGAAMKSILPFLAIGAVVDIFSRWSQQKDAARDAAGETASLMTAQLSGIKSIYDSLSKKKPDDLAAPVKEMTEALKDIGAYSSIQKEVEAADTLEKKYTILYEKTRDLSKGYEEMKASIEAYIEAANRVGGGILSDNMKKDIEQYGAAVIDEKVARSSAGKFSDIYTKELEKKLKEDGKWLESKMRDMDWFELFRELSPSEQYGFALNALKPTNWIWDSKETSIEKERYYESSAALIEYIEAMKASKNAREEVMSDMPKYIEYIKLAAESYSSFIAGLDANNMSTWGDDDFKVYAEGVRQWLSSLNVPEDVKEDLKQKFIESFPEDIQVKIKAALETAEAEEKLTGWQADTQAYFDKHGINIKLSADDSVQSVEKKLQDARKKAQEKMDSMGAILTYWKIKPDLSAVKKFINDHPTLKGLIDSVFGDFTESKSEVDAIDQTHLDTGLSVKDDKKKDRNGGHKTDEQLKKVKERFEEIKTFYSEYKKYAKTYGKEGALVKLEALFPDLKGKDGQHLGRRIVDDYQNVLKEVRDSIDGNTTERKKYKQSVSKLLADIDLDTVKEQLDKNLKAVEKEIQERTSQWNLYKSLLDKTGNKEFAMNAFSGGVLWDDATRGMRQRLEEMVGRPITDWDASDESAKKAFGEDSAALKLYQEIVKTIRNNYTDALTEVATAQEKLLSNQERIKLLQDKIADAEKDTTVDRSAQIAGWREEISKLESELFELLPVYDKIFGDRTFKSYGQLRDIEKVAQGLIDNAKAGNKDPKTGKVNYFTSFYMDGDQQKKVVMTRQQLERLKKIMDDFYKDEKKKDPFSTLIKDIDTLWDKIKDKDSKPDIEDWSKFADSLAEVSKIVADLSGQLSEMFDALGHESMAEAMDDVQAGINSVSNIASGFAQGGIVGGIVAAAGEAIGWVTRIAKKHDAKLEKDIQKSQLEVKKLTAEYQNLQSAIESALGGIYATGGYNEMYESLRKQREEIQRQYNDEAAKKKSDEGKLVDYEQQLKEMDESIKKFGLDMAKTLYDIDLHSWASQLTEAIVGAWEKGEDAAEAYKDKVKELMKDLTSNILTKKVMEKAFDTLGIDKMISEEMFNTEGKLSEDFIPRLTEALLKAGEVTTDVITGVLNGLEGKGVIEKGSESKTSSKVIQGGFTEQETGLLLSYVNAIRGDVSENRMTLIGILNAVQTQTEMPVIARAQLQQLQQVAENTRRNADAADRIYEVLHSNILGANSFQIK